MLGGKLNTLLAVVEQQNFTKAAKALALTQPAVSHHIRELEEELGVQLIVRRGGRIILTPEGEIAVKYARRMKALYDKLHTELMNGTAADPAAHRHHPHGGEQSDGGGPG